MNEVRNERNELSSSALLEAERKDYYARREALDRAIAPLVQILMEIDIPVRIIYNPKTHELKREYSGETQELMDKVNKNIEMFREHFFPSNARTQARGLPSCLA